MLFSSRPAPSSSKPPPIALGPPNAVGHGFDQLSWMGNFQQSLRNPPRRTEPACRSLYSEHAGGRHPALAYRQATSPHGSGATFEPFTGLAIHRINTGLRWCRLALARARLSIRPPSNLSRHAGHGCPGTGTAMVVSAQAEMLAYRRI